MTLNPVRAIENRGRRKERASIVEQLRDQAGRHHSHPGAKHRRNALNAAADDLRDGRSLERAR